MVFGKSQIPAKIPIRRPNPQSRPGGVLTYVWYTGMCRSDGSVFGKKSLKWIWFGVGKPLNMGLILQISRKIHEKKSQITPILGPILEKKP